MFYFVLMLFIIIVILHRLITNLIKLSGFKEDSIQQKTVLISGCDSGFGYELAVKLICDGITTFAGCYTEQGRVELCKMAKEKGVEKNLITFNLDVTNEESVQEAVKFVTARLTKNQVLWGVVNNAGISTCGLDDWLTVQDYQNNLNINCLGVIRVTHAFLPLVKKSKGRVVGITSFYARWSQCGTAPYAVSKHAVSAYLDTIRNELIYFGVTVHIVEPGFFRTALTSDDNISTCLCEMWRKAPQSVKEEYGEGFLEGAIRAGKEHVNWMIDGNGPGLHKVVNSYYHALTARWPRSRYYAGQDIKLALILMLLPSSVLDFIQILFMKLRAYPTPKSCK